MPLEKFHMKKYLNKLHTLYFERPSLCIDMVTYLQVPYFLEWAPKRLFKIFAEWEGGWLLFSCTDSAVVEAELIINKVAVEAGFLCTHAMLESEGGGEEQVWYDGWGGGCLFGRQHLLKGECLFNEIWYTHN